MPAYNYLTEEKAYNDAIDSANTKETLLAVLHQWDPFVEDALAQAEAITDWEAWRLGLTRERAKDFAGEEWFDNYMCILMPKHLVAASLFADQYGVPFGMSLIQYGLANNLIEENDLA